jgi:predicted dehydrogenase
LIAIQSPDRARTIAEKFGIPRACTTHEELLSAEGIEAVVISSSPHLHYIQASAALKMGKHVLLEKPMTITVRQAHELLNLAEQRHLQFLISCPWHYTTHAAAARQLIAQRSLGIIRMISVLMTNPVDHLLRGKSTVPTYGAPYLHPRPETYSDPETAGGGQIYAQVCHIAAHLAFLTGLRACEVFARFHNDDSHLDIYDTIDLRMEDGTIAAIASTGATSQNLRTYEVRIFGTGGMLYMDLWRGTMVLTKMSGETMTYPELASEEIYPHQAPACNLIDSIIDPACNRAPASLGIAAMEIIEAACISAGSGRNVLVPELMELKR